MPHSRVTMRLMLEHAQLSSNCPWISRLVHDNDQDVLAKLMLEAYQGTIDTDGSETLADAQEEIKTLFAGDYGRFMLESSFLLEDGGMLCSASLITFFEGAPLLAFSMTHPIYKRKGLAGCLIADSCKALEAQGYDTLTLIMTEGNTSAQRLYERLGFLVVRD